MKAQDNVWSNLSSMFFDQATKFSNQPFLWFKEKGKYQSLTWEESAKQILKITHALMENGVTEGDRVVIIAENRPEWLIADLAIITCGAITVPAYTTYTSRDYLHILGNCQAKGIVVSNQRLMQKLSPILGELPDVEFIVTIEGDGLDHHEIRSIKWSEILTHSAPEEITLSELWKKNSRKMAACIIYTSGTGGKPKGVVLSHGSILHNCEGAKGMLSSLGYRSDVFLSFLPLSHSYEHTAGQFFPIAIGASIYYSEGIEKLRTNMQEVRPTFMTAVPRMYESMQKKILSEVEKSSTLKQKIFFTAIELGKKFYENPRKVNLIDRMKSRLIDLLVRKKIQKIFGGRLKAMVSGGGPLSYELAIFFEALGVKILQGYGQTESGPVISCNPPEANRLGTVGKVLENVDLSIADDGEILVKGELVMEKYWGDPSLTAETIRDEWLHTGDIGEVDKDGYLTITDRKKDIMVTTGGDNISPQKIEGLLSARKEVHQASVYGDRKPYLVCLIVPDEEFLKIWLTKNPDGKSATEINDNKELKDFFVSVVHSINTSLSQPEKIKKIMLTSEIFSVENGMLTPTMKIKRHKVHDKFKERLEKLYDKSV